MDTRRSRHSSRDEAIATFRWFGWVLLMMFVLIQTAQAAAGATPTPVDATGPLSQANAQFDPTTHQVTVVAPAPAALWNATPDIGAHSFVVYEDRVREKLEDVKVIDTPLSIGVLLEHGGRYHALNDALAEAGSHAIQELKGALNPDDKIAVWTYANTVEPLKGLSESPTGLQLTTVQVPVAPTSESNFYDAVLTVLPRVQQMSGRKVLVVVSSGIDTSSQADFAEVLRTAKASGVPVCPINIGQLLRATVSPAGEDSSDTPYGHLNWQRASEQLTRLARTSGCRAFTPSSSMDLPGVYDGLLANLRLQYVVRYRSTALNLPGSREVRVEWTDGSRTHAGIALTNLHSADKVFADVHYTVDSTAVLAKPTAMNWPFLQFWRDTAVQIPLKPSSAADSPKDGLLAATAPDTVSRVDLGQACTGPPCPASPN